MYASSLLDEVSSCNNQSLDETFCWKANRPSALNNDLKPHFPMPQISGGYRSLTFFFRRDIRFPFCSLDKASSEARRANIIAYSAMDASSGNIFRLEDLALMLMGVENDNGNSRC